jgi:hypothetical protein
MAILNMILSHKGQKSWNKGLKTPKEVKIKQSKSHSGVKLSKNHKNAISNGHIGILSKKIIQLDKNGNFIQKFNSLIIAQNITGTDHGNISLVCHGKRKTANGYKWVFDDEDNNFK